MARVLMLVLWPSFLVAIVAEGVYFSVFDPGEISLRGWEPDLPPLAVYTVGFFFFWFFCAAASMLTCYLANPPVQAPPRG
jgi:hypothetical protein